MNDDFKGSYWFCEKSFRKNPKERVGIKEVLEHDRTKKCSGKYYVKEAVGKQNEKGAFVIYSSAIHNIIIGY